MKPNFLMCVLAATTFAAELPVREVILYKHGVGYFERAGELRPGDDTCAHALVGHEIVPNQSAH